MTTYTINGSKYTHNEFVKKFSCSINNSIEFLA